MWSDFYIGIITIVILGVFLNYNYKTIYDIKKTNSKTEIAVYDLYITVLITDIFIGAMIYVIGIITDSAFGIFSLVFFILGFLVHNSHKIVESHLTVKGINYNRKIVEIDYNNIIDYYKTKRVDKNVE